MSSPQQHERHPDDAIPFKAWLILALLTMESIIAIIDRQAISALKTTLKAEFAMSDAGYAYLVNAFLIPYALFYPICGALADRYGTRRTLSACVVIWSLATLACGMANSLPEMMAYRAVLGAAEAGLLPASVMALVIWFPKGKIGTAGSLRSSLQSIGPIICTPLIVAITLTWGWRHAFVLPGLIGLFFGVMWFFTDVNPPSYADRAEQPAARPKALDVLKSKALWGVLLARVISDPLFFFISYWQAGFLQEKLGLSLKELGSILWIPPLAASVVMVFVGLYSDRLVKGGWSNARSRIRLMQVAAVLSPAILLVPYFKDLGTVMVLLTISYFMSYMWLVLSNILVADLFRHKGVGVAVGLVNASGTLGASLFTAYVGITLDSVGYGPVFIALACLHPLAALVLHVAYGKRLRQERQRAD